MSPVLDVTPLSSCTSLRRCSQLHAADSSGADSCCALGRYGFVVFADAAVTDVACAGLNGMRMGERVLTVRRATEVRTHHSCTDLRVREPRQRFVQLAW